MKEINIKVDNISKKQWPLLLVELNLVAKEWKKYGPKIDIKNITPKQWTNLLIELNLVCEAWKPYGPLMKIKAYNADRIIKWGKKKHGDAERD